MKLVNWILMIGIANCIALEAFSDVVFAGTPDTRVVVSETTSSSVHLDQRQASAHGVVITKIGERYFWASRDNTEMEMVRSGAFLTYTALNGSGYVRVVDTKLRDAIGIEHAYMEHLVLWLTSVTYYGQEH
jgi:hypothetical protein